MKHEFQLAQHSGVISGSLMPVLAVIVFCIFVIIAIFNTFMSTKNYEGELIERDAKMLADTFKTIEKDCKLLGFSNVKNIINFLNVKSFTGSAVGPMNLKHADRWKGPYLETNPSIQGQEYQIIRTHKGYFIVPGDGVKLPNDKIMGKDITFDENSDIGTMMTKDDQLRFKGKALAAPVDIKKRGTFFATPAQLELAM